MTTPNQHPEQIARDKIDKQLMRAGWVVRDKNTSIQAWAWRSIQRISH